MSRNHFEAFTRLTLRGRRWFFRYRANNGKIVFQSEAYSSAAARDKGIASARLCAQAPVEITP